MFVKNLSISIGQPTDIDGHWTLPTSERLAYGKIANVYDTLLALSGFKRGVENFLRRFDFDLPARARILDAGCGTGLMAFYLLRRFPDAEVVAFDIDPKMLAVMERLAHARGLGFDRLTIAVGDLRHPHRVRRLGDGGALELAEASFDGIFVSGALEHVPLFETLPRLVKLLKPGGIFLNLGVKRNPAGAVLGMVYRFRPYRTAELQEALSQAGLEDIRVIRLAPEDFPANLSRIAIMAKKLENRI